MIIPKWLNSYLDNNAFEKIKESIVAAEKKNLW